MSSNVDICSHYTEKWWHFLVPPPDTVYKLCESYDKTLMFLIAVFRTLICAGFFYFLMTNSFLVFDSKSQIEQMIYSFLLVYSILNGAIVLLVLMKHNKFMKTDISKDVNKDLEKQKQYKITEVRQEDEVQILEDRDYILDPTIIRVEKLKGKSQPVGY